MEEPTPLEKIRSAFFRAQSRYVYISTLGHGGMGAVFKVHDTTLEVDAAIKIMLHGIDFESSDALSRFKREINLNRRVKHPNIAQIFEFGLADGIPFISMEFVPGRPLSTILKEEGKMTAERLIPILRQVALGTFEAHKAGIIHRDLKPQNIMVDVSGAVAILDFGLAREQRTSHITHDGEVMGTPTYMSPELAQGAVPEPRSDIWAIGIVAYQALTGQLPFEAPTPLATFMAIVSQPLPGVELRRVRAPLDVVRIIRKCLEKNPEDRYQTAEHLAMDLALTDLDLSVSVDLPGEEASEQEATMPLVPAPPRRPTVLLVDDEDDFRMMARFHLEAAGCSVKEARNGEQALEFLYAHPADLVLMDVMMPKLDGFDTTRILKTQPRFAKLPIILWSAFSERGRLAFAIQSGATDFVSKHAELKLALQKVWKHLELQGFDRQQATP